MNVRSGVQSRIAVGLSAVVALVVALLPSTSTRRAHAASSGIYHQTNLVSDQPGVALITDPNLVNPWGISMSGSSPMTPLPKSAPKSRRRTGNHAGVARAAAYHVRRERVRLVRT